MTRKINICLLLLLFALRHSYSQNTVIGKAEMYEDFDYLSKLVHDTYPYLEIKKQLWNYSIEDSIHAYRNQVEDCHSFRDFHQLINKVMNTCVDGHSALITPLQWPQVDLYIPLMYQHGEYRIKRDFRYKSIDFKAGAKLLAINGNKNIHQEVARQIPNRYLMRWDNQLKLFYTENFYWSSSYIDQGSIELEFEMEDKSIITNFNFNDSIEMEQSHPSDTKRVSYFEKSKILYVRIPSMDWSDRKFYQKEIPKVAKDNEIDKIVLDVRYNMGGSSIIGRNIFRSILPEPLAMTTKIYGNSPKNISKKYRRTHRFDKNISKLRVAELDNLEMYRYIDKAENIKPFKNSIRHRGEIYIIGNEHLYSAGGAMFMFANCSATDSIYSIGTPTGWFLGEFTDPIHFILPHSKLEVQMPPTMSMTDVKNWSNVMLDSYDYTVYPNVNDYQKFHEKRDVLYSEDYLFKSDPYFKMIFEKNGFQP